MTKWLRGTSLPVLVVSLALVLGLVYSQVGWRRALATARKTKAEKTRLQQRLSFPADGESLAASALRVIDGTDTVPLAQVVRGRRAIIYFGRDGCPPCDWLRAQMDTLLPTWRDSVVIVTVPSDSARSVSGLTLDSLSTLQVTGIPAVLVVDSAGFVRHAVRAGLPPVINVLEYAGLPAPSKQLAMELERARVNSPLGGGRDTVAGNAP